MEGAILATFRIIISLVKKNSHDARREICERVVRSARLLWKWVQNIHHLDCRVLRLIDVACSIPLRHLILVELETRIKIAQYTLWDEINRKIIYGIIGSKYGRYWSVRQMALWRKWDADAFEVVFCCGCSCYGLGMWALFFYVVDAFSQQASTAHSAFIYLASSIMGTYLTNEIIQDNKSSTCDSHSNFFCKSTYPFLILL